MIISAIQNVINHSCDSPIMLTPLVPNRLNWYGRVTDSESAWPSACSAMRYGDKSNRYYRSRTGNDSTLWGGLASPIGRAKGPKNVRANRLSSSLTTKRSTRKVHLGEF